MSSSAHVDVLLEEVRQLAEDEVSVVVVEGDTDVALLQGLVVDGVALYPTGGRHSALAIGGATPGEGLLDAKVLIIVDADFDRITGRVRDYHGHVHIVFTDAHDMEVMLISIDDVRRRVLTTALRCSVVDAVQVWSRALDYQTEVSLLRLVAHVEGWSVRFEGVSPQRVEDPTGDTSRGRLVAEVMPRIRAAGLDYGPGEVMRLLQGYEQWRREWPQLVNGHELCGSLSWYARRILGRTVTPESLETAFRIACQRQHLVDSPFGRRVRNWCEARGRPDIF